MEISSIFKTSSKEVVGFFKEQERGFYIPLYQREYSWDSENIEQLMADICQGVTGFLTNDQEILFLGTIIRVREANPIEKLSPKDVRAIPKNVYFVIDGQQRISTLALLCALLYQRLTKLANTFSSNADYAKIVDPEIITDKLDALIDVFSFDLRGTPRRKPIIIRAAKDGSSTLNGRWVK
jgi:uncharacterized protein with ParB-like and HNH nuclease domain